MAAGDPAPTAPPATSPRAPPDGLLCPITQELMLDPVITVADGHSYERAAIRKWLRSHRSKPRAPITNLPLDSVKLLPNDALRRAIALYLASDAAWDDKRAEYLARRLRLLKYDGLLNGDDVLALPPFAPRAPDATAALPTLAALVAVMRGPWGRRHPKVAVAALQAMTRVLLDAERRLREPWHRTYAAMTSTPSAGAGPTIAAPLSFGGGGRVQPVQQPTRFVGFGPLKAQQREAQDIDMLLLRHHASGGLEALHGVVDAHADTDADVAKVGVRLAARLLDLHRGSLLLSSFTHAPSPFGSAPLGCCLKALGRAVEGLAGAHGQWPGVQAYEALAREASTDPPKEVFRALVECFCLAPPAYDPFRALRVVGALADVRYFYQSLAGNRFRAAFVRELERRPELTREEKTLFLPALRLLSRLTSAPHARQALPAGGRERLLEALLAGVVEPGLPPLIGMQSAAAFAAFSLDPPISFHIANSPDAPPTATTTEPARGGFGGFSFPPPATTTATTTASARISFETALRIFSAHAMATTTASARSSFDGYPRPAPRNRTTAPPRTTFMSIDTARRFSSPNASPYSPLPSANAPIDRGELLMACRIVADLVTHDGEEGEPLVPLKLLCRVLEVLRRAVPAAAGDAKLVESLAQVLEQVAHGLQVRLAADDQKGRA